MEQFEIHITGSENIMEVLDRMVLKSLHLKLLSPTRVEIADEYMSSFVMHFEDYETCKEWVDEFVFTLEAESVQIYRVKIECPYYYEHYKNQSVYVEAHFDTTSFHLPVSYNVLSKKYTSTTREYLKSQYNDFITKWREYRLPAEIEFCLYDDNIRQDSHWLKLYQRVS